MVGNTSTVAIDTSWAHGSAGIGLSRLLISDYFCDDLINQEIDIAINHIKKYSFNKNHCINDGIFGNLEVLYALSKKLKKASLQTNVLKYLNQMIVQKKESENWLCGKNDNSVLLSGMFLGLSGIGYNLLRFADWVNVPSILALESAVFNKSYNPLH